MAGAAQAVLDQDGRRRPDRAAPVAVGLVVRRVGGSVARPYSVRWRSIRSASARADVGGQVGAEHDGHQVEQAGAACRSAATRRRGRRTASPVHSSSQQRRRASRRRCRVHSAASGVARVRRRGRPARRSWRTRKAARSARLDDPLGVEGGGVVPAAVVAVLVVRQRVPGRPAGGRARTRSSAPGAGRPRASSARRRAAGQAAPQLAQRPAVDRRLDEVVEHLGVGDRVGQRAGRRPGGRTAAGTGPRPAPAARRRARAR